MDRIRDVVRDVAMIAAGLAPFVYLVIAVRQ